MKAIETLLWILDNNDKKIKSEEEYRRNIEFVHSLGLKCDCVGWSKLNLDSPRTNEILAAIDAFCRNNGWRARGLYTKEYTDYSSDWYEIVCTAFKDNTICGSSQYESENGNPVKVCHLRAYHELRPSPKRCSPNSLLVPERFRDACIRHGITDVDFCWAKDKGKYQAEQYFHLYGNRQIPRIAVDRTIKIEDRDKIDALGDRLPQIADVFHKLQMVSLQDCYLESDIPDCSIAYAYSPATFSYLGRNKFLIHKSLVEVLLKEKAITESDLKPAMVVKEFPGGYTIDGTVVMDRPTPADLKRSIAEYEALKASNRPARLLSEKDALKVLRSAKKERAEDFQKALPRAQAEQLTQTDYAPLLPYYSITNGGYFSDEYEFLPYRKATEEDQLFADELRSEELLSEKPVGIVFAKCADGDRVLLNKTGRVLRFSHEEPTIAEEWTSLAQFVVDAINE